MYSQFMMHGQKTSSYVLAMFIPTF